MKRMLPLCLLCTLTVTTASFAEQAELVNVAPGPVAVSRKDSRLFDTVYFGNRESETAHDFVSDNSRAVFEYQPSQRIGCGPGECAVCRGSSFQLPTCGAVELRPPAVHTGKQRRRPPREPPPRGTAASALTPQHHPSGTSGKCQR